MYYQYRKHFNPRPREEGDVSTYDRYDNAGFYFNPRPREEGDIEAATPAQQNMLFQSTPS